MTTSGPDPREIPVGPWGALTRAEVEAHAVEIAEEGMRHAHGARPVVAAIFALARADMLCPPGKLAEVERLRAENEQLRRDLRVANNGRRLLHSTIRALRSAPNAAPTKEDQ